MYQYLFLREWLGSINSDLQMTNIGYPGNQEQDNYIATIICGKIATVCDFVQCENQRRHLLTFIWDK